MTTLTHWTTLVSQECCACSIPFAVPENFDQYKLRYRHDRSRRDFYCPNGHVQFYTGKTDEQRLRERAERAEAREVHERDQRHAAERSATALKGHLTRLRNRIANGVCPWCKRSFKDVLRHVEGQHPEYAHKAHQAVDA